MSNQVTAELKNWVKDPSAGVLWGLIYNDIHGRWVDGTWIHTSSIKHLKDMELKEGDIVETLNSHYLLGEERPSDHSE